MPLGGWTLKLLPALVLIALALPSSAFGQATRTWVSGVGDDANPCSRTAPCKTFAGAISKTANGGEINTLDSGGFGGVTITKSLTIKARGSLGGALVSGTNAIVVNAAATDKVTLDGLDINGIGTGAQTSLSGVKVLSASRVNIVNSEIYRFKAGVVLAPTSVGTRVVLKNNHIHNNGVGVIAAPGGGAVTGTTLTVRDSLINDNTCGIVSSAFGTNASTPDAATNCGTAASGGAINQIVTTRVWRNGVHDNSFGVFSRGANSIVDIANNDIAGNTSFGLRRLDSGIIRTSAPATNVLLNAADDAPNQTQNLG
ncbi:MAG: hypothetical protein M3389_13800 [Actinomycetota bacterium]|nr:hypothetical protein [Actinomycetota bacterium]